MKFYVINVNWLQKILRLHLLLNLFWSKHIKLYIRYINDIQNITKKKLIDRPLNLDSKGSRTLVTEPFFEEKSLHQNDDNLDDDDNLFNNISY